MCVDECHVLYYSMSSAVSFLSLYECPDRKSFFHIISHREKE